MEEQQITATAIAITSDQPNWALLDEISIPLLETGVGTLPILQAALPTILAIEYTDEKVAERYRKVIRIAQLQIEHLLRSQQELLKQMEKLESENETKPVKPVKPLTLSNSKSDRKESSSTENVGKYKCEDCGKIFLNENFLTSHFERRHPKTVQHSNSE